MYFASIGIFMLVFAIIEPYISDNPENKSSRPLIYGLIAAYLLFIANISYYKNAHPLDTQAYPGDQRIIHWCVNTFGYPVPPKLYINRR